MDQVVRDLVTAPFHEIVEKGNAALDNAPNNTYGAVITKSAQALVKEGERALKKMEPLCKKLLESGPSLTFVNALKDNGRQDTFVTKAGREPG